MSLPSPSSSDREVGFLFTSKNTDKSSVISLHPTLPCLEKGFDFIRHKTWQVCLPNESVGRSWSDLVFYLKKCNIWREFSIPPPWGREPLIFPSTLTCVNHRTFIPIKASWFINNPASCGLRFILTGQAFPREGIWEHTAPHLLSVIASQAPVYFSDTGD